MLVHELMSRSVVTVRPDTTITQAARTLLASDVRAAPVVDAEGGVVGIVSRRDLIVGREVDDPRAHLSSVAHQATESPESTEPPHLVRDVMTRRVVSVKPADDDAHAAHLMVDGSLASVPVLDHDELVGMVSVTDILRSHTHTDCEIARVLRERFFDYGDSHPLGSVEVSDGVVTITDADSPLAARIAEAVAETTEGVVSVHVQPPHPRLALTDES